MLDRASSRRLGAFAVGAMLLSSSAHAAKYNIRWMQLHEPSQAAEVAAREFAARVEKETGGEVAVKVITKSMREKEESAVTGRHRNYSHYTLVRELADGKADMTQIYTGSLTRFDKRMQVLNRTYLFRDYDHAEQVFEGPLGRDILAWVDPKTTGVRTLGIAYSGGFGIFGMNGREARRPRDMAGLKLSTERFHWLSHYLGKLGVEPLSAPPEAFVLLAKNGFADAVETVPSRFYEYGDEQGADHITMTNHYLLTTVIAINEKLFQSLPEKHRETVARVALDTAREERRLAIRLNEEAREHLVKKGVRFVDLTKEEKALWVEALTDAKAQSLSWLNEHQNVMDAIKAVGSRHDQAHR